MGPLGDKVTDLIEMLLHGRGVGVGHSQAGTDAASRTDGAEQIGALVALIGWLAWPGTAASPLTHKAVLLADPCLVLEPDLDRFVTGQMCQMSAQRGREVFLKAAIVSAF